MKKEEYEEIKIGDRVVMNNNNRDRGCSAIVVEIPEDRRKHGGLVKIQFAGGRERMVTRWVISSQKDDSDAKKKVNVGDKVFLNDLSYIMQLERDPYTFSPSWRIVRLDKFDYTGKARTYEVIETDLKIPALFGSGYLHGHLSVIGERTYLDTLIKDVLGDLFLTCNEYLSLD